MEKKGKGEQASWDHKRWDQALLQPFTYICSSPGKGIRGKLTQAFNDWMHIPEDKLSRISEVVGLLHNASLLVDDIEDGSILRRGLPVAHSIYGVASTINAANFVYFLGLEKTLALERAEATAIFCRQMLELHRGQGMELHWRDNFLCPSEDDYRTMVVKKTGGLFMLAVQLMQLFSSCQKDFEPLTALLGLYFQIRDDYANLFLQEYSDNKSFCEDLTEGKFSFPVIHAIRSRPDDHRVLYIVRQRTQDKEVKKFCVSLLQNFGSDEYTRETMRVLEEQTRQEIRRLGGNAKLEAILEELHNW